MNATQNSLSAEIRTAICQILSQQVANCADLKSQYLHAHWNIKGPHFIALHELFGALYGQLDPLIDDMAERIVQLGGLAEGTVPLVARLTQLVPLPANLTDGMALTAALSTAAAFVAGGVRTQIDRTAELGDAITSDLLTEAGGLLDKQVWMLEAHRAG